MEENSLRDYFEKKYRQGNFFERGDYDFLADSWCWEHRRTGIRVWADALDLSLGQPDSRVVFHYTSELTFREVTSEEKQPAEVWAALKSDPGTAWFGSGLYTVPKAPDEWKDRAELLDNNFRNLMKKDHNNDDKGEDYVKKAYPHRVAFCIPILVAPANMYDVSKVQTPEMKKAGRAPGRNLRGVVLNKPGTVPRTCVVIQFADGGRAVKIALDRLMDTLQLRARSIAKRKGERHLTTLLARARLGTSLRSRGMLPKAEAVLREVLEGYEQQLGPVHPRTLFAVDAWAKLLQAKGDLEESKKFYRRAVRDARKKLGASHPATLA